MPEQLKNAAKRIAGTKQLLRALLKSEVTHVFLAADSDEFIYRRVKSASEEAGVPVTIVPTMAEIGKDCGIEVGTAAAGILR